MGFLINKYSRAKANREILKAMEEADKEVWDGRKYLQDNKDRLSEEEVFSLERNIEKAEERYLLLNLKRA